MSRKEFVVIAVLFLVTIGFSYYYMNYSNSDGRERVCFEKDCFNVDLADTPSLRSTGLMFVESLEDDEGMLFIFDESGMYPFWMKDTFIPLDMIWIDEDHKVVFIHENSEPESLQAINPGVEALYVLEINGGLTSELGINVGDYADF